MSVSLCFTSQCAYKLLATPPAWSVPAKYNLQTSTIHASKRVRMENRTSKGTHTPSKQILFFSSPRCPPSPHHKPRASSPLRSSAISPIVIIKRPEQRQPLAPLTVTLQGPGIPPRRITSKDFKLYEDASPFKSVSTTSRRVVSQTKNNNKENIAPFSSSPKEQKDDNPFVRPQPRGPLTKLKRLDHRKNSEHSTVIETKNTIITEDIVTTDYSAGAKIVHETQKKTISSTIKVAIRSVSEDILSPLQMHSEGNWEFDIHNDDCEDQDMIDCENAVGNVASEEEEDKENMDPNSASVFEMDWLGTSVEWSNKRKTLG